MYTNKLVSKEHDLSVRLRNFSILILLLPYNIPDQRKIETHFSNLCHKKFDKEKS